MTDKITVPAPLHELRQWVCWGAPGKALKCPYDPRSGYPAKAGQPDTWAPLNEALDAVREGKYAGIGFEFSEGGGIVGVDFDHCLTAGALDSWAAAWVAQLNSYTEVSPSGTGLHVYCRGTLPGAAVKRPRAEMYDRARYFTFTGEVYGAVKPIRDAQTTINALYEELQAEANRTPQEQPERPQTHTAPALPSPGKDYLQIGLERDSVLASLYRGDRPNGNESADDLALLNKLAYWCNRDAQAMQAAFFASGHYATKDEQHKKKIHRKDYLPRSIARAVADCARTAAGDNAAWDFLSTDGCIGWDDAITLPGSAPPVTPPGVTAEPSKAVRPALVQASTVPYEKPRWTLAPYFQRGKGTLIQGDNGAGKTAFMCAIAAHVSTGRPLLGLPVEAPGAVIMLSVEDDLPILRGRIEADGGDLTRCHFMTNAAGLTFTSSEIEAAIRQVRAKLIVFDPFQAFLGAGVDMFRPNETRPQLAKLFEVCDRNDCACGIIAHTVKSVGDKSPVNRALGSVDIPAAMRSILHLIRNPDNEDECIMVHVKCSNAPKGKSIAYTIGDRGGVIWQDFVDMTAEDLAIITKRKEKGVPYEREPLVQVFNQLITDKPEGGFWSYSDLKNEGAKILGFPPYSDLNDLRAKLDNGLSKELQTRDGMIVTHGAKNRKNERGIRIERYTVPQNYQQEMTE